VGIRELKEHLSAVVRRVKDGETVTLTDRNRPVALIVPIQARDDDATLLELCKAGRLSWSGGKPRGSKQPARVRGPSVSDAVIEDRR